MNFLKIVTMQNSILGLVKASPLFLFISMSLSFVLVFLVQMFYYAELLANVVPGSFSFIMAAAIGLMFQLARLAFGISGISEFSEGKTGKGIIGVLFSLGLTIFGSYEVSEIVHIWIPEELKTSSLMVLQSLVWLGFLLEIRLAINVSGINQKKPNEKTVIENRMQKRIEVATEKKNGYAKTVIPQ